MYIRTYVRTYIPLNGLPFLLWYDHTGHSAPLLCLCAFTSVLTNADTCHMLAPARNTQHAHTYTHTHTHTHTHIHAHLPHASTQHTRTHIHSSHVYMQHTHTYTRHQPAHNTHTHKDPRHIPAHNIHSHSPHVTLKFLSVCICTHR